MDLLCCETGETECRAYPDEVLLRDERVLKNLLRTEERYAPSYRYFECVQHEVNPLMRKIVAEWMMEVCEEQNCQDEIFPLAMNYVDRFLSVCCIRKSQLQLLGTACMLLASKLREPRPMSAETLVFYTDNSITINELWNWELLVLSKLKWDISSVTPQDFLRHILRRLPVEDVGIKYSLVNSHAKTLIALCARDFQFSRYLPSIIAAASVASALYGVGWTSKSGLSLSELLNRLHDITSIEQDYLHSCLVQIEEMVKSSLDSNSGTSIPNCKSPIPATTIPRPSEFTPPLITGTAMDKLQEHEKAGTPTDVRDVHF